MSVRARVFSDIERLERKRVYSRKENMTPEQIAAHNERGRKHNLTPEQIERKNAKSRSINLTPEELETKRSRNRVPNISPERAERNRQKSKEKTKLRKSSDVMFRIYTHVSRLVSFMLKSNNSSKVGESIQNYLSWNNSQLKEHIEKQFEPWMNCNNYGQYIPQTWDDNDASTWKWQLDHIIPRSDLPYSSMEDENFKKCWALSNLRPLSAKQNILDGTSRIRHSSKGKK